MERHGLPKQDPVHAAAAIDPLQLAVELGKERGLTVIPWLEYGFAAEPVGASRGLLAAKPGWAAHVLNLILIHMKYYFNYIVSITLETSPSLALL